MRRQTNLKFFLTATVVGVLSVTLLQSMALAGLGCALRPEAVNPQSMRFALQQEPKLSEAERTKQAEGGISYLGAYLGDVNEDRAREFKLTEARGALVGKVEEGSPAQKAGLLADDVIVAIDGKPVQSRAQFNQLLRATLPGSKVQVGLLRQGAPRNVVLTLGRRALGVNDERGRLFSEANALLATAEERRQQAEELRKKGGDEKTIAGLLDEERSFRKQSEERRASVEAFLRESQAQAKTQAAGGGSALPVNPQANRYDLGLSVAPLSEQLASFFRAKGAGLLVTEVRASDKAERAGIKAGDCLVSIDGEPVASLADFNRLTARATKNALVRREPDAVPRPQTTGVEFLLGIVREGQPQTIKINFDRR